MSIWATEITGIYWREEEESGLWVVSMSSDKVFIWSPDIGSLNALKDTMLPVNWQPVG